MNRILPVEIVLVPPGVEIFFPPVEVNLVLSGEVKFYSAKGVKLFFFHRWKNILVPPGVVNLILSGEVKFYSTKGVKLFFFHRWK